MKGEDVLLQKGLARCGKQIVIEFNLFCYQRLFATVSSFHKYAVYMHDRPTRMPALVPTKFVCGISIDFAVEYACRTAKKICGYTYKGVLTGVKICSPYTAAMSAPILGTAAIGGKNGRGGESTITFLGMPSKV